MFSLLYLIVRYEKYFQSQIFLSRLLLNTKLYVFHNEAVDIKDLKFYVFLSK